MTSTSLVKAGSCEGQALSTASITFLRHSRKLEQRPTETVMILASVFRDRKGFWKGGGETLGSMNPPMMTRGRASGMGWARMSSRAWRASVEVTVKEGLLGW